MNESEIISTISLFQKIFSKQIDIKIDALKTSLNLSNELVPLIPYHINLLDEIRPEETKHSKILHKLLEYHVENDYLLLKSFLNFIGKNYDPKNHNEENDKSKFNFSHEIGRPTITSEIDRIDVLIKQSKDFAIIIENKIHNAIDQDKQLIRYVETLERDFKSTNIYVIYISRDGNEPSEISIKNEKRDIRYDYRKRYVVLSFSKDIINWLKSAEVMILINKNKSLKSAVNIYIEHLEKTINNRISYNIMNEELRERLEIELKLKQDLNIPNDIEKIKESIDKLDATRELLEELKGEYIKKYFTELKAQVDNYLKEANVSQKTKTVLNEEDVFIEIIYEYNKSEFAIAIQYSNDTLKYGVSTVGKDRTDPKSKVYMLLKDLLQEFAAEKDDLWFGYKDTSFESAYDDLINLADKVNQLRW